MKVSFVNYAMPMNKRIQFCGGRIPPLSTDDPNYSQIVANERSKSGLDSLPTDKVASARGGIVWELELEKSVTTPSEIVAGLLDIESRDLIAIDSDSRAIVKSVQILPETKIDGLCAYSLDALSLVVRAFKGLLGGENTAEIVKALRQNVH